MAQWAGSVGPGPTGGLEGHNPSLTERIRALWVARVALPQLNPGQSPWWRVHGGATIGPTSRHY